jgi:hypothetical protein
MVRLLSLRKKKINAKKAKEKLNVGDEVSSATHQDGDGSVSTLSSTSQYNTTNYPAEIVNGSLVAQFAHMSTTIAATLSEAEFGSQKNNFYRQNAEYDSKIIHPVECKRDIFVERVTPVKMSGKRRSRMPTSIYHANVGRERSPYIESNDVHHNSKPIIEKTNKTNQTAQKEEHYNETADACTAKNLSCDVSRKDSKSFDLASSPGDKENDSHRNSVSYRRTSKFNVSTSRQSRLNKKVLSTASKKSFGKVSKFQSISNLRVQTEGIPNVGNEITQINSDGEIKEHPRVSRSTTMEISPSSTVSSLTLPAEIDQAFNMYTPKEAYHPTTTMPIITEDDGKFSEI